MQICSLAFVDMLRLHAAVDYLSVIDKGRFHVTFQAHTVRCRCELSESGLLLLSRLRSRLPRPRLPRHRPLRQLSLRLPTQPPRRVASVACSMWSTLMKIRVVTRRGDEVPLRLG